MSMSANIHDVASVTAKWSNGVSWLEITARDRDKVVIFVEAHVAEAMADAWHEAENYEPEPPTFDEALGMKCDAEARMDEARKLKGMV